MTVSYSDNVTKFLLRWKGSVWKAVWKELFIWLILYYSVRFVFMFAFKGETERRSINATIDLFHRYTTDFPIDYSVGYYVAATLLRWWNQVMIVPWPDELMSLVANHVDGKDKKSHLIRYTVGRYFLLTQVLALRNISVTVRRRFPTINHIVASNLMTVREYQLYKCASIHLQWHLPLCWIQSIITDEAVDRHGVPLPIQFQTNVVQEINKYRSSLRTLCTYCWISLPMGWAQGIGFGLYTYFAFYLIGQQRFDEFWIKPIPISAILKFLFYVGWYKTAQELMKPFDDSDNDVEVNYLLDRHLTLVQSLANFSSDEINYPSLTEDKFFDERKIPLLPETKLSKNLKEPPLLHSMFKAEENLLQIYEESSNTKKAQRVDGYELQF